MSDYNGSNLRFIFNGAGDTNESVGELEEVENYVVVKDKKQKFSIFIKWIPDVKILNASITIINDVPNIIKYPILRWNLSPEIGTITSVSSDYGALTSSEFTTTATFVAGSGINVVFNNLSMESDGELSILFGVSGQSNLFILESQDILNEFQQVGSELPIGAIDYETAVFFTQSGNIKRFILPAGKSKKFTLRLSTSAATSITSYTSGDIRFFTNQPKTFDEKKIFRLKFFAQIGTIEPNQLPDEVPIYD